MRPRRTSRCRTRSCSQAISFCPQRAAARLLPGRAAHRRPSQRAPLARDADLRHLVDVVPFGLPARAHRRRRQRARALRLRTGYRRRAERRAPGHRRQTTRCCCGAARCSTGRIPRRSSPRWRRSAGTPTTCKLFFMGVQHPNPQVRRWRLSRARRPAGPRRWACPTSHVIFNDWVPYQERAAYLPRPTSA